MAKVQYAFSILIITCKCSQHSLDVFSMCYIIAVSILWMLKCSMRSLCVT